MRTRRLLQSTALAAALFLGLLAPALNGMSLLALVILAGVAYSERTALADWLAGETAPEVVEPGVADRGAA